MNPVETTATMTMTAPPPPGGANGRRGPVSEMGSPMLPKKDFHRLRRATIETPIILLYAAVIVTIITILYWLLGG
jgi:hypothetical protein